MSEWYVRSTNGSPGAATTWASAETGIGAAISNYGVAGDTFYVSQVHAETTTGSRNITAPSDIKIICGNDAAEPPTTATTGASVSTTGSGGTASIGFANSGSNTRLFIHGVEYNCGSSAAVNININVSATGPTSIFRYCKFILSGGNSASRINVGATQSGYCSWYMTDVKFSHASQRIVVGQQKFRWNGGSLLSGGTSPSALITTVSSAQVNAEIDGVDLSNLSSSADLVAVVGSAVGRIVFRNCKLPASWSGSLGAATYPGMRLEMHNCDNADTNYREWIETYYGSIKSETTIVRSGGASDGTTPLSWKLASSANVTQLHPLETNTIEIWNDTAGSSKTVTVEVVTDGVTLKDDECWIEVEYLGTSGYPLGSFVHDSKSTILSSASNQASSSVTWTTTGLSSPAKQKLEVTFTPQEKGWFIARVMLGKASQTVYVDPALTVT